MKWSVIHSNNVESIAHKYRGRRSKLNWRDKGSILDPHLNAAQSAGVIFAFGSVAWSFSLHCCALLAPLTVNCWFSSGSHNKHLLLFALLWISYLHILLSLYGHCVCPPDSICTHSSLSILFPIFPLVFLFIYACVRMSAVYLLLYYCAGRVIPLQFLF